MGLIRLEFDSGKTKITAMPTIIASSGFPNKPKLLDQVRDVIRRKHYSIRTEQAYLDWRVKLLLRAKDPALLCDALRLRHLQPHTAGLGS